MQDTKPRFATGSKVKPVPEGFHSVTPYLTIKEADKAIEFYKKAFNAKERTRMPGPNGKVMHAELTIGDSIVMMAEENPEHGCQSPTALKGSPVGLALYVQDADAVFQQAVNAGATVVMPMEDRFYGDRAGGIQDPFGHKWMIMTHIEDVSAEEIKKRMATECAKSSHKT